MKQACDQDHSHCWPVYPAHVSILPTLPRNGNVVVVKRDCATCKLTAPIVAQLRRSGTVAAVFTQDDPAFPEGIEAIDDTALEMSWHLRVDTVPSILQFVDGQETRRTVGWSKSAWHEFFGTDSSGVDVMSAFAGLDALPDWRPGCGSMTQDYGMPEKLAARYDGEVLRSRRVDVATADDEMEQMYARGWTDGLPVVAPTAERVMRMLAGTPRQPSDIVAIVPPNLVECTVEKVAVNAVMAGCLPEYLPVVLTALEAACTSEFNAHGLLATTYFAGPVIIVNGPITRGIGMNSGVNALGQGNRANSTIGRAVQLVIRNVGGGVPGGVDRATLGNPGKVGFSFAEDESDPGWTSLATERGIAPGASAVTLFAGEGPRALVDQLSRDADSLARSFASGLRSVGHPKLVLGFDAIVVVAPEHLRTFRQAGWDKDRLRAEIMSHLQIPAADIMRGADGIAEGVPPALAGRVLPKFRPGGLWFVRAGGAAGMFSAIIGGWANGAVGSEIVTKEIAP